MVGLDQQRHDRRPCPSCGQLGPESFLELTYALCLVVMTVSETTTYGPITFTTHGGAR